jgi:2-deoxy-D-gluconate 3-dehydrogenase
MTVQSIAQLFDLTGKGAIVTGGALGIGQGIALRLAEAGASVMVSDIDLNAAHETVKQIESTGGKAQAIRADAASAADAVNVARSTVEAFGRLDILINNAGIYPISPLLQMSEDMWDKVLDLDLKGVFLNSQAAAQEMIKAEQGGKIVNIASTGALRPAGNTAHYNAAKGGIVMLTKALALELAPYKILVNALAPSATKTPTQMKASAAMAEAMGGLPPEEPMRRFEEKVPLKRIAEPDDIAKVALFLVSAAADYMTGTMVLVDGGILLT